MIPSQFKAAHRWQYPPGERNKGGCAGGLFSVRQVASLVKRKKAALTEAFFRRQTGGIVAGASIRWKCVQLLSNLVR